ncbi:metal ABC transporter ATP-binding protein [Lacrimispora sp. 210928-DFI.3.58]|uniref:metal ABC transporter ATP-binding protein n=1 Tax=Lacrimispora sp. 210928-DFI.3.58 TaxID=2883214 RepID=UPI0015B5BF75|nr:metal ABC transporter ATP-binding protein [Lacrimispora sp. 210928-DFI.3.58]MCB7320138.1 metal ABC transporter ATP-binding protein [Lacrimispora sp. 210928-DFI.3.58]
MRSLITCEHVDFGYDNQDAVIDVNMEVVSGDYLCIVGENGSGKSTLMKGLLGLLKPTAGKLTVDEGLKKTGIGYLPQQTAAQKDFPATVFEVVLSGCLSRRGMLPFYSAKEKAVARENMEKLGITPLSGQCYRELSGGQQQRVLIARALCATTDLLILDEPITGLDPMAIQEFYAMIRRLNREDGVAILMVSHDLRNAVEEANKILHLQKRVMFYGPAHDYMNSKAAGHFFHEKEQGICKPTAICHGGKLKACMPLKQQEKTGKRGEYHEHNQ